MLFSFYLPPQVLAGGVDDCGGVAGAWLAGSFCLTNWAIQVCSASCVVQAFVHSGTAGSVLSHPSTGLLQRVGYWQVLWSNSAVWLALAGCVRVWTGKRLVATNPTNRPIRMAKPASPAPFVI